MGASRSSIDNMQFMKLFFLAMIATAVCALPSDDAIPEVDADTLLQTTSHAEASDMLAKAGANACTELANATEDEVKKNVEQQQTLLDKIDKGQDCKNKGQSGVTTAKDAKMKATSALADAEDALAKALKAKIDFGKFEYDQLEPGKCDLFFNSKVYTDAKAKADAANKARDKAKGALDGAKAAVDAASKAAFALAQACACKIRGLHETSLNEANANVEKANIKAWTKAAHLKCVIAGTTAANCKVPALPKVEKVGVAEEVKKANCGPNDCTKTNNCLTLANFNGMKTSAGTCTKTGSTGWSSEAACNSQNCYIKKGQGIEFQWMKPSGGNGNLMFGLDQTNSQRSYTDIDWAIQCYASGAAVQNQIYEAGAHKSGSAATRANGANTGIMSIRWCKNNEIRYFYNRVHWYTSSKKPSNSYQKLIPSSSFYTTGGKIAGLQRISFGDDCNTEYPTFGV